MRVLFPWLTLLLLIGCGPGPGAAQVGELKVRPLILSVGSGDRRVSVSLVNGKIAEGEDGYWLVADQILVESSGGQVLLELTLYEDLSGNGELDANESSVEFEVGAPIQLAVSSQYPRLRADYKASEWPAGKVLFAGEQQITFAD